MPALSVTMPLVLKTTVRDKLTFEEDGLLVDVDLGCLFDVGVDVDVVCAELESWIGGPNEGIGGSDDCTVVEVVILHHFSNVWLPGHLVDIIINFKDIPRCIFARFPMLIN